MPNKITAFLASLKNTLYKMVNNDTQVMNKKQIHPKNVWFLEIPKFINERC